MNISPPLCEMLADPLLQERYTRHLENLLALAEKELDRVSREDAQFYDAVKMYVDLFSTSLDLWNNKYNRNLINAFRELQEEGVLEIITCCATHGFLPLISTHEAKRAQVEIAVTNYKKHFGRKPRGIWLAECAYEPGVENLLKDFGIEYFIGDSHAILVRRSAPALRRSRARPLSERCRAVCPRCRNFAAGLERGSRLSGRSVLSRILPRCRLGFAARILKTVSA